MSQLTIKQEAFCNAYLETGCASEAYRIAFDCDNMSPEAINVEASRLLKNPKITLRVNQLQAELRAVSSLTKQHILSRLSAMLEAKITDYLEFDGTKIKFKDFSKLTDKQLEAIESVKHGRYGIELKLHGKPWTIERICKMLGYDTPQQVETKQVDEFSDYTDEQLKEFISGSNSD